VDGGLTNATNDEGDHEPGARADHLEDMQAGDKAEEDDEQDGCAHGGEVVVVFEAIEDAAAVISGVEHLGKSRMVGGMAGQEGVVKWR